MPTRSIAPDDDNRRLDRLLRKAFPDVPPGALAGAVRRGNVRLNGKRCRNNTRVRHGDRLTVPEWTSTGTAERLPTVRYEEGAIYSSAYRIPVLERTKHHLAVNKPAGLTTHGPESLAHIVLAAARRQGWWKESLSFRPGPVHRLDRNTSGVQLFALSIEGARTLSNALATGSSYKLYLAIVEGAVKKRIDVSRSLEYDHSQRISRTSVATANAHTAIVPLESDEHGRFTLVAALPTTGRTHQIRAHCASAGHPLRYDRKYGGSGNAHYFLHALIFAIPEVASFWNAPLPDVQRAHLETTFLKRETLCTRIGELVRATCTTRVAPDTIAL